MTAYINHNTQKILDAYLALPFVSSYQDTLFAKLKSRLDCNGLVAVNVVNKIVARIDALENTITKTSDINYSITTKPGNKSHFADEYLIIGNQTIRFIRVEDLNRIIQLDSEKIHRNGRVVSQAVLFKLSQGDTILSSDRNKLEESIRENLEQFYNIKI